MVTTVQFNTSNITPLNFFLKHVCHLKHLKRYKIYYVTIILYNTYFTWLSFYKLIKVCIVDAYFNYHPFSITISTCTCIKQKLVDCNASV